MVLRHLILFDPSNITPSCISVESMLRQGSSGLFLVVFHSRSSLRPLSIPTPKFPRDGGVCLNSTNNPLVYMQEPGFFSKILADYKVPSLFLWIESSQQAGFVPSVLFPEEAGFLCM